MYAPTFSKARKIRSRLVHPQDKLLPIKKKKKKKKKRGHLRNSLCWLSKILHWWDWTLFRHSPPRTSKGSGEIWTQTIHAVLAQIFCCWTTLISYYGSRCSSRSQHSIGCGKRYWLWIWQYHQMGQGDHLDSQERKEHTKQRLSNIFDQLIHTTP